MESDPCGFGRNGDWRICDWRQPGVYLCAGRYPVAVRRLNIAIEQAKEWVFWDNIFGSDFNFDIEVRMGAGAFVCGEETP
jgi:NADH:ubiquinone oxidoreductase subunit F (NADH-binding)